MQQYNMSYTMCEGQLMAHISDKDLLLSLRHKRSSEELGSLDSRDHAVTRPRRQLNSLAYGLQLMHLCFTSCSCYSPSSRASIKSGCRGS